MTIAALTGQANGGFDQSSSEFKLSKDIAPRVHFWESIFVKHTSNDFVVHDVKEPWLIIDVLPFVSFAKDKNDPKLLKKDTQKKLASKYMDRYRTALKRFAKEGKKKAIRHGAMERRVHTIYSQSSQALRRLYKGEATIRYQQGLADTFIKASKRAQDYLPYVEREFRMQGVPIEVSRLAFVESMFNSKAISKVGASGMWQFMPATAKSYMKVNSKIDERNSPLKAARAAAKLLAGNYKTLESWPLAITAYNHGRTGMKNAVEKTGTKNLATIIKKYKKRSFGFASQNFYAEFLAALRTYNYLVKKGIIDITPSNLDIVSVKLKRPVKVKDLHLVLNVPHDEIKNHNSCIKNNTYTRHKHYTLPKNFELFIPRKHTKKLNYKFATLKTDRKKG